jgi:DNA polymerase-3 subunit delta
MAVIQHNELEAYAKKLMKKDGESPAPVYLLFGEEFIYKSALNILLDAMVPAEDRKFHYEAFEGYQENILEAVRQLNTYSLLGGMKVVALLDSDIFYTKQDEARLIQTLKQSIEKDRKQKAAQYFSALVRILNIDIANFDKNDRKRILKLGAGTIIDGVWIDELVAYCVEHQERLPASSNMADMLVDALENGFPKNHCLIITSEVADRRRRLFKAIDAQGLVVDCSVPKGERRADKAAQDYVLNMKKDEILGKYNKKMNASAYASLCEKTGFDLRTFSDNLFKLIDFIGDREEITASDVSVVVKRTKQDPIYEFTNAVTDQNIDDALFYLNSLLAGGVHPLQMLTALVNQVRRLVVVKTFTEKLPRGQWHAGLSYHRFQNSILPLIIDHDKKFLQQLEDWERITSERSSVQVEKSKKKKSKTKKGKPRTDLLIAQNPKNPYPVFKTMQKAEGFTMNSLRGIVEMLGSADGLLKSTGHSPASVLENLVLNICRGG